MKKLLFIAITTAASMALAKECGTTQTKVTETKGYKEVNTVVPKHLEGASITITKADGTQEVVKAEEFMLVKRKHKRPVVGVVVDTTVVACKKEEAPAPERKRNILSAMAVRSQAGLSKKVLGPHEVKVTTESDLGLGALYQRNVGADIGFEEDIYLGVEADTNSGFGLTLGVGF